MAIKNSEIGDIFNRVADLLELENANVFRVRAYRSAAMAVTSYSQSLAEIVSRGEELPKIPGVGKDLQGKIIEIINNGTLSQLKQLEKEIPVELTILMTLPGLGAKRVKLMYDKLGVKTFEDLEKAVRQEKIRSIRGLGEKVEQNILEQLQRRKGLEENILIAKASPEAAKLLEYLLQIPGVDNVVTAGSVRRRKETVRDLDILVTGSKSVSVMKGFISYPEVKTVLGTGYKKTSVVLKSGLQVDIRVVPKSSFGAALVYFTGSKAHNIAIRKIGVKNKLKINEYGVFRGRRRIAGQSEEDVYASIGLPYIPPELREDQGEIEAAVENRLPRLVEIDDIRGDLHCHTTATDGRSSLEEMIEAAISKKYEYLAITEHTGHLTIAGGLESKAMRKRYDEIRKVIKKYKQITILKGAEVEILEDGSLDMPDELLKEMDVVIGAVHYKFGLPKDKQTARILRAMDNPYFGILAHPTGRQINQRPPYEIDLEAIIKSARDRRIVLECNCQPARLDLKDMHLRMAKQAGVRIVISTDCHDTTEFDNLRYGLWQARRGWIEAKDVLNTFPLNQLIKELKRK